LVVDFDFRFRTRNLEKAKIDLSSGTRVLPLVFPETETSLLVRESRRQKISINSLVNAALLLGVRKHFYHDHDAAMAYINFADLRPHLEPPVSEKHVGSLISMIRATVRSQDKNPIALARQISEQITAALRRGDRFSSFLLSAAAMRLTLDNNLGRMGTAALSYNGATRLNWSCEGVEIRDFHTFVSNLAYGPLFSALVRILNGKLYWDIMYLDTDLEPDQAAAIGDHILEILRSVATRQPSGK
jgi:hypothetical protein